MHLFFLNLFHSLLSYLYYVPDRVREDIYLFYFFNSPIHVPSVTGPPSQTKQNFIMWEDFIFQTTEIIQCNSLLLCKANFPVGQKVDKILHAKTPGR